MSDDSVNTSEFVKLKNQLEETRSILNQLLKAGQKIDHKYKDLETGFYRIHRSDSGAVSKKPNYQGMADYLVDRYKLLSSEAYSYIYQDNYYQYIGRNGLANLVSIIAKENLMPNHLDNFIKLTIAKSFDVEKTIFKPDGLINIANGILDVKSQKLMPHSHQYFFKYILPHKYDASAECPRFLKFLNFIFDNDPQYTDLTSEIFGYCLLGGNQFLHKSFVLYGSGRNGKSTWLEILQSLLGYQNISSVSLANLTKPFSVVNLDGKLANIVDETPNDQINAEAFKTATSGGWLTGAHKGKPEYPVKCNARFLFASNKIPNFSETTVGLKERLYFIKFSKFIEADSRDPYIKEYIVANEMSGILNFALIGLRRLLERGYIMPTTGNLEMMEEFNTESDSVFEWGREYVEIQPDSEVFRTTREIYSYYKDYCSFANRRPVSYMAFAKRLASFIRSETSLDTLNKISKRARAVTSSNNATQQRGFYGLYIRSDKIL